MMMVVTGVGTLIHIYAVGYMHDDVRHTATRLVSAGLCLFHLFIASMLILVTANNFLMLFVVGRAWACVLIF